MFRIIIIHPDYEALSCQFCSIWLNVKVQATPFEVLVAHVALHSSSTTTTVEPQMGHDEVPSLQ